MNMAQVWSVIGFLATSLAAMVAMMYRSMSIHGRQMTDALDGLRSEMRTGSEGLRHEMKAGINGLRGEMIARFEKVDQRFDHMEARLAKVETIDREVHALSLKVFGQEGPPKPP
jgi:hypothetical protein